MPTYFHKRNYFLFRFDRLDTRCINQPLRKDRTNLSFLWVHSREFATTIAIHRYTSTLEPAR